MCNNFKDGFFIIIVSRASETSVPNTDEPVIWTTGKDALMEFVPSDIFNGSIMMQNFKDRLYSTIFLLILLNIPNAYPLIWETRQQQIFVYGVPAQSVPLTRVTYQFAHCFVHCSQCNISFTCSHCDDFGIGGAVSRTVDFSTVLYLFNYCYFMSFLLEVAICFGLVGIVDFDFEEVALVRVCIAGGDDGEVASVVIVHFWFWQPLEGIGGPVDGMK